MNDGCTALSQRGLEKPRKCIALVAGEASGDRLGAGLIGALRKRCPGLRFVGVAGPLMRDAGCEAWYQAEQLSVMGLAEVVRHLPRLLRLRRSLTQQLHAAAPDCLVGIDAPDFNIPLEARMRRAGIPTVHYVSPSVWAWRPGRVKKIRSSTDLVLTLFPFETEIYHQHGVQALCVGHPLADARTEKIDRPAARAALGLEVDARLVGILPGSRMGEVVRLLPVMLEAARCLLREDANLQFALPCASENIHAYCKESMGAYSDVPLRLLQGRADVVLEASQGVLVASGTATLEAMLARTPMVVVYRLSRFTEILLRGLRLVNIERFSLPNLLAKQALVPEFLQGEVRAGALASALIAQMLPQRAECLSRRFAELHRSLRCGADGRAAEAVLELIR